MSSFGDALQQLLQERGISQRQLASRLGVTPSAVNLWVKGHGVKREWVDLIEDELAVDPRGSLLEAAGYTANNHAAATIESLIRADPGLDAEDKRVLLRILRIARERSEAQ